MSHCPIHHPTQRIGAELNEKWTLVHLLGVGGSSAVFEAVHRNGRRVALKMLSEGGGQTNSPSKRHARRLAVRESLLANAIEHPGVVAIFDNDEAEDGSIYLVMELLEGETLERMRCRLGGGRLPLETALPFFDTLLDVLEAAHARGIVHRDLKPENVFLTNEGQLKVLDFGLAMLGRDDDDHGRWFGTPGFMAPEQARGDAAAIDATTDLWAVAATLFTTLTGELVHRFGAGAGVVGAGVGCPRDRETRQALVNAAIREDVDLSPLESLAPIEVIDVLERALAFDKQDRWQTAAAMRGALKNAASSSNLKRWRRRGQRVVLPTAPPIPHCHSATRVFRIGDDDDDDDDDGDVGRYPQCGSAHHARKITCTICPICPELAGAAVTAVPSARLLPPRAKPNHR